MYSKYLADQVPQGIVLGAVSLRFRHHGPVVLIGGRVQRWWLLVRLLGSRHSVRDMCPIWVLEGHHMGIAPTEAQDLRGVVPNTLRSAVEPVSQLCLNS